MYKLEAIPKLSAPWDRACVPGTKHRHGLYLAFDKQDMLTVMGLFGGSELVQSHDGEVLSDSPFSLFQSRSEGTHTSQDAPTEVHQEPRGSSLPPQVFCLSRGVLEHLAPRGQSPES